MEPLTLVQIVVGALSIATIVGGILMKAFVNPISKRADEIENVQQDQETRLRVVEKVTTEHDVHIEVLTTAVEKLVASMADVTGSIKELVGRMSCSDK